METVNVNKASADELQKIKGVGIVRSKIIIETRPFKDLYELSKISGLGKKRMEAIIQQDILIEI